MHDVAIFADSEIVLLVSIAGKPSDVFELVPLYSLLLIGNRLALGFVQSFEPVNMCFGLGPGVG